LLVLKRAVKLKIPLEQAFDHIAPLEIGYRAGLSRRSLNRFHSLVQAGEEPLSALSNVAPHMMPPALSAMLFFASRKGTLKSLLDDVCPELHESPKSPAVQQLGTIYIMLWHGVMLILLALASAVILPKLIGCFIGTNFEAVNQLPRIGTVWVAGSVGVLISLFFVFLFVKAVWGWDWYSGASGMSRCWMSSRPWEASRMVSAVVWMIQHDANEADALDELLSALPQKSSAVRSSVEKAFSVARSGAPWGEIATALIAFAGGQATSSANGIPSDESPGVWAESFFLRIWMAASQRYRFAVTYLLPLETGMVGGVTGWMLVFVYRFIQTLPMGIV
jgi:hypothetical protein